MKTYVKVALALVALFAIAGILIALYYYNLKASDMSKAKPDFKITASALQKAFEDDETKASATYINKILEVTGKISSIKPAEDKVVSVSLVTGSDLSSVNCTFPAVRDPSVFKDGR